MKKNECTSYIYLIENAFDARPATSFAFDVFFSLRCVARPAANGFGWRYHIPSKSQLFERTTIQIDEKKSTDYQYSDF